jgi:hypothetical protein
MNREVLACALRTAPSSERFEWARALLSHELPSGEMAALFELASDPLLGDRKQRVFSGGRKPRRARRSHSPGECASGDGDRALFKARGCAPASGAAGAWWAPGARSAEREHGGPARDVEPGGSQIAG